MPWKRLPTYLVNYPLRLLPFTAKQRQAFDATGFVSEVAFRTIPRIGKLEIKEYLQRVYGLNVAAVRTLNYEGRKKRSKNSFYQRPGYKKVYVSLRPSAEPS